MSPFRDEVEAEKLYAEPESHGEDLWVGEDQEDEEAELFDVSMTEWEEEDEAPPIPSSRIEWPGASDEKLAFMRAVYERHFENSVRSGRTFVANLAPDDLDVIEGRHQGRKNAAKGAREMLAAARAALAADGLDGKVRIGVVSAYRPAEHQFGIWEGKGRNEKGGFPYYYKRAIKEGAVADGDYGQPAVERMARYIGQYIASPGFSNHQDGLAIDFGTGSVGRNDFGTIGQHSWFHHWLVENAERFGYHPYVKETWHWTYRTPASPTNEADIPTAAARAKRIPVDRVSLLRRHRGQAPDLVLGWNDMTTVPAEIDVVVHLHGFWYPKLALRKNIEPVSGLDLAPPAGATGTPRTRPTLTVLPRGDDTGVKMTGGPYNVYRFPALVTKDGLEKLITLSLERFASEVGAAAPRVGRLILTAHSGGGAALMEILRHHDPHQVHVFDALYGAPDALTDWAGERIRRDAAAVKGLTSAECRAYMASRGGALRVFYQDRRRGGTRPASLQVRGMVCDDLGPELKAWYRVEASKYDHFEIPQNYGWRVLGDASADVPNAYIEHPVRREAEHELESVDEAFVEPAHEEWEEEAFDPGEAEGEGEGEDFYQDDLEGELSQLSEASPWTYEYDSLQVEGDLPPDPPVAPAGAGGAGKWVMLVAGFDYERSGVNFESIAEHRMQRLIRKHATAAKSGKLTPDETALTAPRFIVADVKSGRIRKRTLAPSGTWTWSDLATFDPVSAANYTPIPGSTRKVFNTDQAGRMAITDILDQVRAIGRTEPGSLGELSFFSHGWVGGPLMVNSDQDPAFDSVPQRDPNDKDPRLRKDFLPPQMDATGRGELRAAFDVDGFSWAWGCAFANAPRQVLHQILKSRKYGATALGAVKDTDTFHFEFSRAHSLQFFAKVPSFFPPAGADGQFPLTFDRTFDQIKAFFILMMNSTYFHFLAVVCNVPCFAAFPGTYADYEKGVSLPLMVVPTKKPPYSDNFIRSIQFYTTYFGLALDPEDRHYGRYDP